MKCRANRQIGYALLFLLTLLPGAAQCDAAANTNEADEIEYRSIAVGGVARDYYLHMPSAPEPAGGWPLVMVLHGAGGDGRIALRLYHWPQKADDAHFIVVGLNALQTRTWLPPSFVFNPRAWNNDDPGNLGSIPQHDDVGYVRAVLDDVEHRYRIDSSRVYATGFSSGAGMTHRLGVELSDRFAAIAAVGGIRLQTPPPQTPLSVMMIFGRADPLVPYTGGTRATPWGVTHGLPSVAASIAAWTRDLHCAGTPAVEHPHPDVERRRWLSCAGHTEVQAITIDGLGHHWAGGKPDRLPEMATGPQHDVFDDTAEVWKFFAAHPRQDSAVL
jgi:polyhydroxybutyrate depolymerase